jgi:radical SAM superfamily enzyme YgiQ (UPF0313 family)
VNILLIWPKMPEGFYTYSHVIKVMGKKSFCPPLGLITLAAMLPKNWLQRLVDLNVSPLIDNDLAWADFVFISAMVNQKQSVRQVIPRCKEAAVKIVAGGPLFHFEHRKFEAIDHFILNEAEVTLPLFLEDLKNNNPKRIYATDGFADLKKTPAPRWELLDLKQYAIMGIQSSRGCPYRCEFCSIATLFGRKFRHKASQQIIDEIDSLYQQGWRGLIYFCDDNFLGNKKFLKFDLLPAMLDWRENKKDILFSTSASIDLSDDADLMKLMVRVGFESVFVGIESVNDDCLKESGKVQNLKRDLIASVKKMQRAGLEVSAGFIVGFDHDSCDIFSQLIKFIQDSGIAVVQVAPLTARDGSDLFKRLKADNRISWEGQSIDYINGETNIVPLMGAKTLQKGFQQIVRTIYSTNNYCQRVWAFLKETKSPEIKINPFLYGFLPILRSLYFLLIQDKERIHYARLLAWTMLNRPKMFGRALKLVVAGQNFRKLINENNTD